MLRLARSLMLATALVVPGLASAAVLAQERLEGELDEPTRARLVALETALDNALLGASDPASLWLRGLLTRSDDEARARDLLAAHRAAPGETLYLASLALSCHMNRVPRPAACGENDWIAKWASVDSGNAAPWVLLAERSLRVRQAARSLEDLAQASARERYDEYWARAVARAWTVIRRTGAPGDDLGVLLATRTQPLAATAAAQALCRTAGTGSDSLRDACVGLGAGAMSHADSLTAQLAAAEIVERTADDAARREARNRTEALWARERRCADWLLRLSGAPRRDATSLGAWAGALETLNEERACAQYAR